MTTMSNLYANIALEALCDSAGECKCEALYHETPCSQKVVAKVRYTCEPGREPLICQSFLSDTLRDAESGFLCMDCKVPLLSCWTIIPV